MTLHTEIIKEVNHKGWLEVILEDRKQIADLTLQLKNVKHDLLTNLEENEYE